MRTLVYVHSLEIGGCQLVAINLAAAMRERGHDIVILGPPGPLRELAVSRGLEVLEQPRLDGSGPSARSALRLREVVRRERFDLVHAYSHAESLEAFIGPYVVDGIPIVCSARGEVVPRPLPRSLPLVVAQNRVAEEARRLGHREVHLIRPMVDTEANRPGAVDPAAFVERYSLDDTRLNVVLVSRLVKHLKLDGLRRAIDAVASLARSIPVRLVIVGQGEAEADLRERARTTNEGLGTQVIVLTGSMLDPRPAYAVADVVMGMQGSLVRGMAFGKPAIVLGEGGFSEIVTPESAGPFLESGFYGRGDGRTDLIREQLETLLDDGALRAELGRFSRQVVCDNLSLEPAADQLERIYRDTRRRGVPRSRRLAVGLGFSAQVALKRAMRSALALAGHRQSTSASSA